MPTDFDDIITIRSVQEIWGLGGADEFRWYGGSSQVHGGDTGERYDANVYGEKTGGDRLFILTDVGARVRFVSTEIGTVEIAGDTLTFTGIERLHLGDGNDTVQANHSSIARYGLSVYANGGDDRVVGSRGDDFVDPGSGNDIVRAGDGHDFVQASKGNDRILGGAGNDNIRWGQGNFDEVVGSDRISGGPGMDVINVWIKDGWLNSGGVQVSVTKVSPTTAMTGTSFTDVGGARSTLKFQGFEQGWTHEGRDTVSGADARIVGDVGMRWNTRWGDDVLIGTRGDDTLEGGAGRDTITGGHGDDVISANEDHFRADAPGDGVRDLLVFRAGDGHDTVLAFDVGVDQLDVGGRDYEIDETELGIRLDFGGGDSILLRNVFDYYV
jgi:Ca2+-binding RTX toxin-like protein